MSIFVRAIATKATTVTLSMMYLPVNFGILTVTVEKLRIASSSISKGFVNHIAKDFVFMEISVENYTKERNLV